ncbi:zf-HC2 domain-containing protein [Nocardioides sp. KIGAM211]|uniref:Zf-HC2 domain-containing protein n=1 Tax=Nocardioides luti TaxID=2761101 RepID=A0A7X0RGG9_9ACTN|nr:zf-HC2 domain-containing protein [Nocardioides luti]
MSALLDGQLPPDEAERAWAHVHGCHACRDQVEREGWVKTRLAGLSYDGAGTAPDHLKGSLLGGPGAMPPGEAYLAMSGSPRRRSTGLVAIGGGAVGAAVMGVLALGVASGDVPTNDRRAPVTHLVRPSDAPRVLTPSIAPVATPARRAHHR